MSEQSSGIGRREFLSGALVVGAVLVVPVAISATPPTVGLTDGSKGEDPPVPTRTSDRGVSGEPALPAASASPRVLSPAASASPTLSPSSGGTSPRTRREAQQTVPESREKKGIEFF